jgi:hypothetical protein
VHRVGDGTRDERHLRRELRLEALLHVGSLEGRIRDPRAEDRRDLRVARERPDRVGEVLGVEDEPVRPRGDGSEDEAQRPEEDEEAHDAVAGAPPAPRAALTLVQLVLELRLLVPEPGDLRLEFLVVVHPGLQPVVGRVVRSSMRRLHHGRFEERLLGRANRPGRANFAVPGGPSFLCCSAVARRPRPDRAA